MSKIKTVNNMDELSALLQPDIKEMTNIMADKVYKTLNYFLQEYYDSYNPVSYKRQYELLRSAVKVQPKVKGDTITSSVYIDYDSLDNYYNATGLQVVEWANDGLHGGQNLGRNTPHIWDDTMKYTVDNNELLKEALKYLKSKGFDVTM